MKRRIGIKFVLACVLAVVTNHSNADSCPETSVQVRNVKLFNKCYCKQNTCEELDTGLGKHGLYIDVRGDGTGWSDKVNGKEWFSAP